MTQRVRKFFLAATAVVTMLCCVGAAHAWDGSAAARFSGGNGYSEANAFEIATAAELAYLAQSVNEGNTYEGRYFNLTADIDLSGHQWTPIGVGINSASSGEKVFKGTFDGNMRSVSGMTITSDDYEAGRSNSYVGLFGLVAGANIINVSVVSHDISVNKRTAGGELCVGALIGRSSSGTVNGSFSYGSIAASTVATAKVGGLIGESYAAVSACYADGSVSVTQANDGYVGGLVGWSVGNISSSFAVGRITSSASNAYAGGMVGRLSGAMINVYSNANVSAGRAGATTVYSGGLVGLITGNTSRLSSSYAWGTVDTAGVARATNAGGVIGRREDSTGSAPAVVSCDWIAMSGVSLGIADDQPVAKISLSDVRSVDRTGLSSDILSIKDYLNWDEGAWTFAKALDGGVRPRLKAFLSAGNNAVKRSYISFAPSVVNIKANESKRVKAVVPDLSASVEVSNVNPLRNVRLSANHDIITVSANKYTISGDNTITVDISIGTAPALSRPLHLISSKEGSPDPQTAGETGLSIPEVSEAVKSKLTLSDSQFITSVDLDMKGVSSDLAREVLTSADVTYDVDACGRSKRVTYSLRSQTTAALPLCYAMTTSQFDTQLPSGEVLIIEQQHTDEERAAYLVSNDFALIYSYVDGSASARPMNRVLIAGPDLSPVITWGKAFEDGIAVYDPASLSVKFNILAMNTSRTEPWAVGNFLVVPDGDFNEVIDDPAWVATIKRHTPDVPHGSGGGGGCAAGAAVAAGIAALVAVGRRRI